MELKKLKSLAISESGFIFDPASGSSYTTNETGLFILNELKHGKTTDEIQELLMKEYDVDESTVESDLMRIIEQLQANYLI